VGDLKERLETRKNVDRAKGLLQSRHGLDEAAAYRWLQRASMDARRTMAEVAELVITDLTAAEAAAEAAASERSGDHGVSPP